MILIVGLGNPGKEYENTRHNIGWSVLEDFIRHGQLPEPHISAQCAGVISEGLYKNHELTVLFPTTYMNNSGSAVRKCLERSKTSCDALIVVHDEIDLPLGQVRISYDRGAGGHNGVRSVIETCDSQAFTRIRVGIGKRGLLGIGLRRPKGEALSKFVLGAFTKNETTELRDVSDRVIQIIECVIEKGREAAMQKYN